MFRKKMLVLVFTTSYFSAMEQNKSLSNKDWQMYRRIIALKKQNMSQPTGFIRLGNRRCYQYNVPMKSDSLSEIPDELPDTKEPQK